MGCVLVSLLSTKPISVILSQIKWRRLTSSHALKRHDNLAMGVRSGDEAYLANVPQLAGFPPASTRGCKISHREYTWDREDIKSSALRGR